MLQYLWLLMTEDYINHFQSRVVPTGAPILVLTRMRSRSSYEFRPTFVIKFSNLLSDTCESYYIRELRELHIFSSDFSFVRASF